MFYRRSLRTHSQKYKPYHSRVLRQKESGTLSSSSVSRGRSSSNSSSGFSLLQNRYNLHDNLEVPGTPERFDDLPHRSSIFHFSPDPTFLSSPNRLSNHPPHTQPFDSPLCLFPDVTYSVQNGLRMIHSKKRDVEPSLDSSDSSLTKDSILVPDSKRRCTRSLAPYEVDLATLGGTANADTFQYTTFEELIENGAPIPLPSYNCYEQTFLSVPSTHTPVSLSDASPTTYTVPDFSTTRKSSAAALRRRIPYMSPAEVDHHISSIRSVEPVSSANISEDTDSDTEFFGVLGRGSLRKSVDTTVVHTIESVNNVNTSKHLPSESVQCETQASCADEPVQSPQLPLRVGSVSRFIADIEAKSLKSLHPTPFSPLIQTSIPLISKPALASNESRISRIRKMLSVVPSSSCNTESNLGILTPHDIQLSTGVFLTTTCVASSSIGTKPFTTGTNAPSISVTLPAMLATTTQAASPASVSVPAFAFSVASKPTPDVSTPVSSGIAVANATPVISSTPVVTQGKLAIFVPGSTVSVPTVTSTVPATSSSILLNVDKKLPTFGLPITCQETKATTTTQHSIVQSPSSLAFSITPAANSASAIGKSFSANITPTEKITTSIPTTSAPPSGVSLFKFGSVTTTSGQDKPTALFQFSPLSSKPVQPVATVATTTVTTTTTAAATISSISLTSPIVTATNGVFNNRPTATTSVAGISKSSVSPFMFTSANSTVQSAFPAIGNSAPSTNVAFGAGQPVFSFTSNLPSSSAVQFSGVKSTPSAVPSAVTASSVAASSHFPSFSVPSGLSWPAVTSSLPSVVVAATSSAPSISIGTMFATGTATKTNTVGAASNLFTLGVKPALVTTSTTQPTPVAAASPASSSNLFGAATIAKPLFSQSAKPFSGFTTTGTANLFSTATTAPSSLITTTTMTTTATATKTPEISTGTPGLSGSFTAPGQLFQFGAAPSKTMAQATATTTNAGNLFTASTQPQPSGGLFNFGAAQPTLQPPAATNASPFQFQLGQSTRSAGFSFGQTPSVNLFNNNNNGVGGGAVSTAGLQSQGQVSASSSPFVFGQTPAGVSGNPFSVGAAAAVAPTGPVSGAMAPRRRPTSVARRTRRV